MAAGAAVLAAGFSSSEEEDSESEESSSESSDSEVELSGGGVGVLAFLDFFSFFSFTSFCKLCQYQMYVFATEGETDLSSLGRSGGRDGLLILLAFFVLLVNLDGGSRSRFGGFGHFIYNTLLFEGGDE